MANSAIKIVIDDLEFREALRQIIATDKKGFAFVINDQAIRLCQAAIRHSKAASENSIKKLEHIKWTGRDEFVQKHRHKTYGWVDTGKRKKGWKDTGEYSRGMFAVMQHIRKSRGLPAFKWHETGKVDYIGHLISERKMSLGYIKAGWIPAIKMFEAANRKRVREIKKAKIRGKGHGYGTAAMPSLNPIAIATNNLQDLGKLSMRTGNSTGIGEAALRAAVPERVADMKRKLEERMNRDHAKFMNQIGVKLFR